MLGLFAGRQHNKIRELLSAYIDGEVSEAETAQVDEHLEQCDECRAEFESLSSTVNLLIALPQLDLPRSFVLTEEPAPAQSAFSFVWPTRVAAGMAAAFLLALLLGDFAGFITQSSSFEATFESAQVQPAAPAAPAPAAPAPPPAPVPAPAPAAPAPAAPAPAAPAAPEPASPAAPAPAAAAAPRVTIETQKTPQVDTSEQAVAPAADVPSIAAAAPVPAPAAPAPAPATTPTPAAPAPGAPGLPGLPGNPPVPAPTPEPAQAFTTMEAASSESATADVTEPPREAAANESIKTLPSAVPPVAPTVAAEQLEAATETPVERTSPLPAIEVDRTPVGAVEQATSAPPEETAPITDSATDDDDGLDIPLWQLEVGTVAALVALLVAVVWITRRRRFSP